MSELHTQCGIFSVDVVEHEHDIVSYVISKIAINISFSLVPRLSRAPARKESLVSFEGFLGCAESACSKNG